LGIHYNYQSLGFLADKVLTVNKKELLHYISGIDIIIDEICEIAKGVDENNKNTFNIFNNEYRKKIIESIKNVISLIDKKVNEFNSVNKEIEKLSLELQKRSDIINQLITKIKDTRKKYQQLETRIKTQQNNMNPLDIRQTQILIKKLKEEVITQEKEKSDISQSLTDLRIKYKPKLQKYQMLEDTLYNKNDDQLYKDKAIKYELNSIMVFLEQLIIILPQIKQIQEAVNTLYVKLNNDNTEFMYIFKKTVNFQINKTYPFGDHYFNIMTVLIVYFNYIKGKTFNTKIKENFESKLLKITENKEITPEIVEKSGAIHKLYEFYNNNFTTKNNISTRLFNMFNFKTNKGEIITPEQTQPLLQNGRPNQRPNQQPNQQKKKKNQNQNIDGGKLIDIFKHKEPTDNKQVDNKQPENKPKEGYIKNSFNTVKDLFKHKETTDNKIVDNKAKEGYIKNSFNTVKDLFKSKTKHINLSDNFEDIIIENINDINNSQYKFIYKILLQFKEQFLQKNANIDNPYYFNFIFTSMIHKYLYQDYYKTIDDSIYNYINTDIYSKDLKNDIYIIYGKNNNIFLFNNNDKEYNTIITYLKNKYSTNWNAELKTDEIEHNLISNLKSPIEDEHYKHNDETIKGGSDVLLQTDIIYQICTPLFLAYQYQKININTKFTNTEFIKSIKNVFYDSYNFAVENDPNRVLKTIRGQLLYNSIKNSFNGVKSIFKNSNKLKKYTDLLKEKKPRVCHDIEEKFNLLKEKCKPHDYSEDIDNLYDMLVSSFNYKKVPLEHKVILDIYPSLIDQNKTNVMVSDKVSGDSIINNFTKLDESFALNPFLEPSVSLLKPIQENIIDVTLPDLLEEQEEQKEIEDANKKTQKTISIPNK
jgi:hypothetical protein